MAMYGVGNMHLILQILHISVGYDYMNVIERFYKKYEYVGS
jgi:hypothetical protein